MNPVDQTGIPVIDKGFVVESRYEGRAFPGKIIGKGIGLEVGCVKFIEETQPEGSELFDGKIGEEGIFVADEEGGNFKDQGGLHHLVEDGTHNEGLVGDAEGIGIEHADAGELEGLFTAEPLPAGWEGAKVRVGDPLGQVNFNTTNGIDKTDKGFKVDHGVVVGGHAEVVLDDLGEGAGTITAAHVVTHAGGAE